LFTSIDPKGRNRELLNNCYNDIVRVRLYQAHAVARALLDIAERCRPDRPSNQPRIPVSAPSHQGAKA